MSRVSRLVLMALIVSAGLVVPEKVAGEDILGDDLTVGVYMNARGFLSLGFSLSRRVDRQLSLQSSAEVPILLSAKARRFRHVRIAVAAPYGPSDNGWGVRIVPEIFFLSQRNNLGRFRSWGVATDVHLGYWEAGVLDLSGGNENYGCGSGAIVGIEWVPVTWIAPSEYLSSRFEGIPGTDTPSNGYRFSTRLNWRLGLFGERKGPKDTGFDASLGLRGQPNRQDAFMKGFPYGELPFFLRVGGGVPIH